MKLKKPVEFPIEPTSSSKLAEFVFGTIVRYVCENCHGSTKKVFVKPKGEILSDGSIYWKVDCATEPKPGYIHVREWIIPYLRHRGLIPNT